MTSVSPLQLGAAVDSFVPVGDFQHHSQRYEPQQHYDLSVHYADHNHHQQHTNSYDQGRLPPSAYAAARPYDVMAAAVANDSDFFQFDYPVPPSPRESADGLASFELSPREYRGCASGVADLDAFEYLSRKESMLCSPGASACPLDAEFQTPMRKRSGSMPLYVKTDLRYANSVDLGLITPQSAAQLTPNNRADGGRMLDFSTPLHRLAVPQISTPQSTPPAPAYGDVAEIDAGTNPFYRPPSCMRPLGDCLAASPKSTSASAGVLAAEKALELCRQDSVGSIASSACSSPHARHGKLTPSDDGVKLKPFKCVECSKCFRRMEHLRRHLKVHTLERPFECHIPGCNRRFSRSDNLKAHIKTHAKRKGRNIYVEGLEEQVLLETSKKRRTKGDFLS